METIYVNLKILSQLKPFERVNTRREFFTIQKSIHFLPSWFLRWMDGSNRESDYGRIRDLYTTCGKYLEHKPGNAKMTQHLRNSVRGLRALKKTYEYDITHLARIDTLIEMVQDLAPEDEDDTKVQEGPEVSESMVEEAKLAELA